MQDVHCRMLHWTVTDTAVSPSQGFMLYSSITPVVHMVGCSSAPVQDLLQLVSCSVVGDKSLALCTGTGCSALISTAFPARLWYAGQPGYWACGELSQPE